MLPNALPGLSLVIFLAIQVLPGAADTRKPDLSAMPDGALCRTATYGQIGKKKWKIGSFDVHVAEAKSRGLDCGVVRLIHGPIVDLPPEEVKLRLRHLDLYDGTLSNELDDETLAAIDSLLKRNGFAYTNPESPEAITFVAEVFDREFNENELQDVRCAAIWAGEFSSAVLPIDGYLCDLGTTLEEIALLGDNKLCALATHESIDGRRWNVAAPSLYSESARTRGLTCGVDSVGQKDLNVAQVQTRLHHFGYDPGVVDGAWGRNTRAAFEKFLEDRWQDHLDPQAVEAESFLFDAYDQHFNQTARSSVPCESVTDFVKPLFGPCAVIGYFNGTRTVSTMSQWDHRQAFPETRKNANGQLEVVMWAADWPKDFGVVHSLPGQSQMINFPVSIEDVFSNSSGVAYVNRSRKMPFHVRRREIVDMDRDGITEFFLLGSREDGRGDNLKRENDAPANMLDYNFIYDFETDQLTTFGRKLFSHDYGLLDFDGDGHKEILDMAYGRVNSVPGFDFCHGKTLKCRWQRTRNIFPGLSSLAYDEALKAPVLLTRCGKDYFLEYSICWFEVTEESGKLDLRLLDEIEFQPPYDAKIRWQTFYKRVAKPTFRAWKVKGEATSEQVMVGGGGYLSRLEDLDNDGDLDAVVYDRRLLCRKKDKNLNYFSAVPDCDTSFHFDRIFIQTNGKFEEANSYADESFREITVDYRSFDLNNDGLQTSSRWAMRKEGASKTWDLP